MIGLVHYAMIWPLLVKFFTEGAAILTCFGLGVYLIAVAGLGLHAL
jgi:hypothetical protein